MQKTIKNNLLELRLNSKVYSLGAIYSACYVFIDKAYLFLDGDPKKEIIVTMKGKKKLSKKQLEGLAGEFFNELLSAVLRINLAQHNKKIRQYIVERALVSAAGEENLDESASHLDDPLGIAVPWEEKYSKKTKNSNEEEKNKK